MVKNKREKKDEKENGSQKGLINNELNLKGDINSL